jgi:hypothetical protein
LAYAVSIDYSSKTILIKGTGHGTTIDTLRLIAELGDTLRRHPYYNVLYDSRELEIDSSPADMMKVASCLFSRNAQFGYFAVVVPPSREMLGRVFAALANDCNVRVNVFQDLAEAWRWIAGRPPEVKPLSP